LEVVHIK